MEMFLQAQYKLQFFTQKDETLYNSQINKSLAKSKKELFLF